LDIVVVSCLLDLFISNTPARFYLSVELGFIVCFLHFMHICLLRHYSTLRNVQYLKRKKKNGNQVYVVNIS